MLKTTDKFSISVKNTTQKAKEIVNSLMICSFFMAIVYFCIYGCVVNDDAFLEYSEKLIGFLPHLLFADITDYTSYLNTGFFFLIALVPLFIIYYFIDVLEDIILKIHLKYSDTKEQIENDLNHKKFIQKYMEISQYSICLSIDFNEAKKSIDFATKEKLSEYAFNKILSNLTRYRLEKTYRRSNSMVFLSRDFAKYDDIYSIILKTLAKIKKSFLEQNEIDIIPSITTDAYKEINNLDKVIDTHKEIKLCNFLNRACTTALFLEKYNFLGLDRFGGIPVGLYTSCNGINSYNLNIVYKNLSKTLNNNA